MPRMAGRRGFGSWGGFTWIVHTFAVQIASEANSRPELEIFVRVRANLFPLQRLDKGLATGVVIGIRRGTHAQDHLMLVEDGYVFPRGVLNAATRFPRALNLIVRLTLRFVHRN